MLTDQQWLELEVALPNVGLSLLIARHLLLCCGAVSESRSRYFLVSWIVFSTPPLGGLQLLRQVDAHGSTCEGGTTPVRYDPFLHASGKGSQ